MNFLRTSLPCINYICHSFSKWSCSPRDVSILKNVQIYSLPKNTEKLFLVKYQMVFQIFCTFMNYLYLQQQVYILYACIINTCAFLYVCMCIYRESEKRREGERRDEYMQRTLLKWKASTWFINIIYVILLRIVLREICC